MTITSIWKDEDLSKFVNRVFAGAGKTQLRRALQAIRDANPHLPESGRIPEGTPVLVPAIPEVKLAPRQSASTDAVQILLEQARAQLPALSEALLPRLDQQSQALQATLDLAASADVKKATGRIPELKTLVADIVQNSKAEIARLDKFRGVQKEAIAELADDLNRFAGGNAVG